MKFATAVEFRTALEHRLSVQSAETGVPIVRLRKAVAFDRFLARLVEVAPDRWALKGALALEFRLGIRTRMTRDLDLGRHDDDDAATEDFVAAQAVDCHDFFSFQVERTERFEKAPGFSATRYHVHGELAGRLFEEFPVDVAFSDPLGWKPDEIAGSDLLRFAEIDPVKVPVIPIEQHLAEKVHAYTRLYGETRTPSSRPKDLIDIVLVAADAAVEAAILADALTKTFAARASHDLPLSLRPPPDDWKIPYARLAGEVGLPEDLQVGHASAAALINPVLVGTANGKWDPATASWE